MFSHFLPCISSSQRYLKSTLKIKTQALKLSRLFTAKMAATDGATSAPIGFHTRDDGYLYCDDIRISDLHHKLNTSQSEMLTSPAFVYSRRQIVANVKQFQDAFKSLPVPAELKFAMKANHNLEILKLLKSENCGVTLVSGMEMKVALEAGFEPGDMVLNGSGKVPWEIALAVKAGVLLNVDSEFCLQHTINVSRQLEEGTKARVLLRLNLDIDPHVHKYVSTGTAESKFGLDPAALSRVVRMLTSDPCPVRVVGLHSHLGSTIEDTSAFRKSVQRLLTLRQELIAKGLKDLRILNVGGGLAIDYTRYKSQTQPYREEEKDAKAELNRLMDSLRNEAAANGDAEKKGLCQSAADVIGAYILERIPRSKLDSQLQDFFHRLGIFDIITAQYPAIWRPKVHFPKPADLIHCLDDVFVVPRDNDVTLMFEPGRCIVGDAGAFITSTLGWKTAGNRRFLVVDGGMNDVIRPSLYGAYHHLYPAAPPLSSGKSDTPVNHSSRDLLDGAKGSGTNGHGDFHVVDVVGPVCESGDFLGKDRLLPLPPAGGYVVLHDAGAYCSSMASNYNLRLRPAEVMVDGSDCDFVRRPDTLNDLLAPYKTDKKG